MTEKELRELAQDSEIELEEGLSRDGVMAAISKAKGW